MESLLGKKGAYINRVYYCPHHPEKGYEGERKEYKITCKCPKPDTGMIDQAVLDMNIDLNNLTIEQNLLYDKIFNENKLKYINLIEELYEKSDKGVYFLLSSLTCRDLYVNNTLLKCSKIANK